MQCLFTYIVIKCNQDKKLSSVGVAVGIVVPLLSTKFPLWKVGLTVSSRDFALFWGDRVVSLRYPFSLHMFSLLVHRRVTEVKMASEIATYIMFAVCPD